MVPRPDSPVAAEVIPSGNHGERLGARRPDMLLLHYTGMPNGDEALRKLCDPRAEVSAHYFVCVDGRVLQLVPEARRAWHAGVASWHGEDDVNSLSIGVEIDNPGHDGGMPPFAEPQIAAVIALCRDVVARWAIPADRVLGHSDVAPLRKLDPGEVFPWARLAAAGVGHYVAPAPLGEEGPSLARGASGPPVAALRRMLALYGYPLPAGDVFDDVTAAVVTAFQRHFRPARIDGIADPSTVTTLRNLIAARP